MNLEDFPKGTRLICRVPLYDHTTVVVERPAHRMTFRFGSFNRLVALPPTLYIMSAKEEIKGWRTEHYMRRAFLMGRLTSIDQEIMSVIRDPRARANTDWAISSMVCVESTDRMYQKPYDPDLPTCCEVSFSSLSSECMDDWTDGPAMRKLEQIALQRTHADPLTVLESLPHQWCSLRSILGGRIEILASDL